jgi:hypothetical protein
MVAWPHAVTLGREWWRRKRSAAMIPAGPRSRHFHYCVECDSQWPHPGESAGCILHWATRCPACQSTSMGERRARTA